MRIRSNFTDTKFIYIYDLKFQLIIKNINNNNRDLAVDISWGGSSCPMFPSITQISKVGFSGGRKTWGAQAKPSEKGQQKTCKHNLQVQEWNPGLSSRWCVPFLYM